MVETSIVEIIKRLISFSKNRMLAPVCSQLGGQFPGLPSPGKVNFCEYILKLYSMPVILVFIGVYILFFDIFNRCYFDDGESVWNFIEDLILEPDEYEIC